MYTILTQNNESSDLTEMKMSDPLANLFKPLNEIEWIIDECFEFVRREHEIRLEAENANRRKDAFLAVVSHELRNTLNSIGGWVNLLCSGRLDESAAQQAVEAIKRGVKLQTKLVEDLLDVSQISSGTLRLNFRETEISSVIKGVLNDAGVLADAKQIELETTLEPDLGILTADSERLEQVLWNLVSNAIKFTPPQGKVSVRTKRTDSCIEMQVTDTGRGIEPEFLPQIFDPFSQSEPFSDGNQKGLGLGLSIVRQIVELHGGNINACSAGFNQGATFKVQIPHSSATVSRTE